MTLHPNLPGSESGRVDALFKQALIYHQAGDLEKAEALYRQVLGILPQHFDAKHSLGVISLQRGRLDEARVFISEALALEPRAAAAHNNLGNVYLRMNRLEDAKSHFMRAVQLQPGYAAAHLNLGNLLRSQGKLNDAAEHLRTAATLEPSSVSAQSNLGAALFDLGDVTGAVRAFEEVVKLQPAQPQAYANLASALAEAGELLNALDVLDGADQIGAQSPAVLASRGVVLAKLGRYPEAQQCLERVLALNPGSAPAHTNLGMLLRDAGKPERAIAPLQRAIQLDPGAVAAHIALAQAMREAGREDDADEQLLRTLEAHPQSAEALAFKGLLCLDRDDRAGAECALLDALALQPDNADVGYQLGNLCMLRGRADEALDSYRKAVAADANHVQARWAVTMAQIPAIARDTDEVQRSREKFAQSLAHLDRYFDARRTMEGYKAVGSTQPFYLAYQPYNNRELLARHGALCARLMAPWQTRNVPIAVHPANHKRIRVGFASAHLRDHSVWNAIGKGWVKHLDRRRFELVLFNLGGRCDAETALALQWADQVESGHHNLLRWAQNIAEAELDVIIYPEIGMDAMTTKLASLRLAPVQVATWGHPETTGLPTIDYFLSAEDLEPVDAQSHYTERLVKLPKLGVCYEPMNIAPAPPDLVALGLPRDVPLLLCPGQPFKYAPEHDPLWVKISRRVGSSRLVFFNSKDSELSQYLSARLEKHYRAAGLDFENRVTFVPFRERACFYGLMKCAQLFLDPPGFSGFNTVMQAVECGLPVVARQSP